MDNRELLNRGTEATEHARATAEEDLRTRWLNVAEAWFALARERRENDKPKPAH